MPRLFSVLPSLYKSWVSPTQSAEFFSPLTSPPAGPGKVGRRTRIVAGCDRGWPQPGGRFGAGPRSGVMRIVVNPPTGNVGSRVVQLLLQAGARPTLLARDPARLASRVLERADV